MNDNLQRETAERLYSELQQAGIDVLLDDREERPGAKFKDADLIGLPYRVTVGNKLKENMVELLERKTKQVRLVSVADIVNEVIQSVHTARL